MKMKKIPIFMLLVMMVFMASACGKSENPLPEKSGTESVRQASETAAVSQTGDGDAPDGFVKIPGGTFQMGSPETEDWRSDDETLHAVTVSDFYMGIYEVTQTEYQEVMGENPSNFTGDDLPVENLTALVVDEAHRLSEAARQMYGKSLCRDDVLEISHCLEREHRRMEAKGLREAYARLLAGLKAVGMAADSKERTDRETYACPEECIPLCSETASYFTKIKQKLERGIPGWITNRLGEAAKVLALFGRQDESCILYLQEDKDGNLVFCATSREVPERLYKTLWEKSFPVILTSGTLKAGSGFDRARQSAGLLGPRPVRECVAESPFDYKENCLLYLSDTLEECRRGSRKEAAMIAGQIRSLVKSTAGYTLVLFTSYSLMGSVCRILREDMPFPVVEMWRHAQQEIAEFKAMENAVLFAAGSCWEGVDFPGDMVSSLIIVRLPFAVPDPVSEAEREEYGTLREYIRMAVLPDMQKKLRQGFGRAIRTESDTCVVSILDRRAVPGGRYHEDVLCVLPECRRTGSLKEVEAFIRERKREGYYL